MKSLLLTLMAILFLQPLHADENLNGTKTARFDEVVAYYSKFVRRVEKPFYIWTWFSARANDPNWGGQISFDSPAGYNRFQKLSRLYWKNFCSTNPSLNPQDCGSDIVSEISDSRFGAALYTALDPTSSREYGGDPIDSNWVLMQIHVPAGFRIMDLNQDGTKRAPPEVLAYLLSKGCSTYTDMLSSALDPNVPDRENACSVTIRKIFKDSLRVDGFAYDYVTSQFTNLDCDTNFAGRAIIVTASDRFKAEDIQVFNSRSRDALRSRSIISAVFQNNEEARESELMKFWPDARGNLSDKEVASWMQENIVTCMKQLPFNSDNTANTGVAK